MRPWLVLLVVCVLLSVGTAACVGVDGRPFGAALTAGAPQVARTQVPSPSSAPQGTERGSDAAKPPVRSNALLEALRYIPAVTSLIQFTDWTAVKDRLDMAGLNSGSDEAARRAFAQALRNEPITAMYGMSHFLDHAANWGWDSLDLEWEATLQVGDAAPVYVLRFQSDEPLERLRRNLKDRDFESGEYAGVPTFEHPLDLSADWIRTTELAIHNIAVFETDRTLLLSSNGDVLRAVVDIVSGVATLAKDDATQAVVQSLGDATTAIVMPDEAACLSFAVNPVLSSLSAGDLSAETIQEELDRIMPVQPQSLYTALAIGLISDDVATDKPVWKVVLHYPTADQAQTDLPQRRLIAEEGMSTVRTTANRELFTVEDAQVQGQDAMLWLAPVGEDARILIKMVYIRDLAFLACP